jgi:hypothetical protein
VTFDFKIKTEQAGVPTRILCLPWNYKFDCLIWTYNIKNKSKMEGQEEIDQDFLN